MNKILHWKMFCYSEYQLTQYNFLRLEIVLKNLQIQVYVLKICNFIFVLCIPLPTRVMVINVLRKNRTMCYLYFRSIPTNRTTKHRILFIRYYVSENYTHLFTVVVFAFGFSCYCNFSSVWLRGMFADCCVILIVIV